MSTLNYLEEHVKQNAADAVSILKIVNSLIFELTKGIDAAKALPRTNTLLLTLIQARTDLMEEQDAAIRVLDNVKNMHNALGD